jgi:Protein kinase domain
VLEEKIGEGGMGEVYRARHLVLGTTAAVKCVLPSVTYDLAIRERFLQEARTQAQLDHQHVVRVIDVFEAGERWYLASEYLPSGSLEELTALGSGAWGIGEATSWAQQLLEALDFAHQRGVIHRDVKPSNILRTETGEIKITDFGIARVMGAPKLTAIGVSLGTPQYMSPEQIVRPLQVDHRTDVYSVGLVLYELLAGNVPFDGDTDFEVKRAQVHDAPRSLRERNPLVSEELEGVVLKALEKDPNDRFQGCGEMLRALDAVAGDRRRDEAVLLSGSVEGAAPAVTLPESKEGVEGGLDATSKNRLTLFVFILGGAALILAIALLASYDRTRALEAESLESRSRASLAESKAEVEKKRGDEAEASLAAARELSSAKSWPLVFSDAFSSAAVSSVAGWGVGSSGSSTYWSGMTEVSGGALRWTARALRGFTAEYKPSLAEADEFFLSVDVRAVSCSGLCEYGLVLKSRSSDTRRVYFRMNGRSFRVVLNDWSANEWKPLQGWLFSDAIRESGQNRLAVIAAGSRLRCFINDSLVADLSGLPTGAGLTGISLELSSGLRAVVEFDNFELRRRRPGSL